MLARLADATVTPYRAAREAIGATLASPAYVASALMTVGVDDLVTTLSYVDRRMPQPDGEAGRLASVLRRQAPVMRLATGRHDPTLANQQLVYEAATSGALELARRFADQFPRAGLLTLWPPPTTGPACCRPRPRATADRSQARWSRATAPKR